MTCKNCGQGFAVVPRGNGRYYCYMCQCIFDIDDEEANE